jgi:hypothetical protein
MHSILLSIATLWQPLGFGWLIATLGVIGAALLILDMLQTRYIVLNPQRYQEAWNVLIKRYPDTWVVYSWFAFWIGVQLAVSFSSTVPLAWIFVIVIITMECSAIENNIRIGIPLFGFTRGEQ